MDKHHGEISTETLNNCLFECDHLSEYGDMEGFLCLNMNNEDKMHLGCNTRRHHTGSNPMGIRHTLNERLLLTIKEFEPLLKYHLLEWCCDESAFLQSLHLRHTMRFRRGAIEFIHKEDQWIFESLKLLDDKVSKKARNFVAELLEDSDWCDTDCSDDDS